MARDRPVPRTQRVHVASPTRRSETRKFRRLRHTQEDVPKGETVAKYLLQVNYTLDGIRGVLAKGGSARKAAAQAAAKSAEVRTKKAKTKAKAKKPAKEK